MEEKEGVSSFEVTVKGDEGLESYRLEPRNENPSKNSGSTEGAVVVVTPAIPVNAGVATSEVKNSAGVAASEEVKKKRGRPRKYAPDGSVNVALSPMPISASIPLTGNYSAWKHSASRPKESFKKKHKLDFESPGNRVTHGFGANFTPHVITVNVGEDVTMKIMSFAQEGCRAICILSANGSISNVTLCHPNSSGGTLTYEGRFEILSLSGSFMPSDNIDGVAKSRSGGMSVSLAGPDGRVLGGGLSGMLIAAGAVQVVVGSFLAGNQLEPNPKKPRHEHTVSFTHPIPSANLVFGEAKEEANYGAPKTHKNSRASFHGNNSSVMDFVQGSKIAALENNISFTGSESTD